MPPKGVSEPVKRGLSAVIGDNIDLRATRGKRGEGDYIGAAIAVTCATEHMLAIAHLIIR